MDAWRELLWHQFGAGLDMLEGVIRDCPEELWHEHMWTDPELDILGTFWWVAFHTLKWTDLDMSDSYDEYTPAMLITKADFENENWLPDHAYTKTELLEFCRRVRIKTQNRIAHAPNLLKVQDVRRNWIDMSVAELMLYNLRHLMEHEGNLSMLLGQRGIIRDGWMSRTGVR